MAGGGQVRQPTRLLLDVALMHDSLNQKLSPSQFACDRLDEIRIGAPDLLRPQYLPDARGAVHFPRLQKQQV